MQAFEPTFYDADSQVLILGSFPSSTSRAYEFYYQHPHNRFWKILESLFDVSLRGHTSDVQENISMQKAFLKERKIVLWDTIRFCNALSSSDNDLRDIELNEGVLELLESTLIKAVLLNGSKAREMFCKLCKKHNRRLVEQEKKICKSYFLSLGGRVPQNGGFCVDGIADRFVEVFALPSTSPANARYKIESLLQDWKVLKNYI